MLQPSFKMEWRAQEYKHKERSSDWFWAVGIISVSLAIASVILSNIIFGILIIIGSFTLLIFASRPPSSLNITVDEKGIIKDSVRYPYQTLVSFWIDTEHSHKKIILQSEKLLMPLIIIPLDDEIDIEQLHEKLSLFLPEKHFNLPLIERLMEYLGF